MTVDDYIGKDGRNYFDVLFL